MSQQTQLREFLQSPLFCEFQYLHQVEAKKLLKQFLMLQEI
jgi:hypothetical protein